MPFHLYYLHLLMQIYVNNYFLFVCLNEMVYMHSLQQQQTFVFLMDVAQRCLNGTRVKGAHCLLALVQYKCKFVS